MALPKKSSKLTGQVRIIGGSLRHRRVCFHDAPGLRPSTDFVRERLFNWLGQNLSGLNVADLFAGSGVLGFEAASRHANAVQAFELSSSTARQIQMQAALLGVPHYQLMVGDVMQHLRHSAFPLWDVVFLDPPYVWDQWETFWPLLRPRLTPQARVYTEAAVFVTPPDYLEIVRKGKNGLSHYWLAQCSSGCKIG